MLQNLQAIIEKKRSLFRDHTDEMVAAYKRELETTEGYNGRQLLELIQNCDDEGAEKVEIKIDPESRQLTISNTGKSFSIEGYRSIVTSNLSAKHDKKRYIGNKGLGFRSIVNWADEIKIHSNDLLLTFGERVITSEFRKMFKAYRSVQLNKDYGLKSHEIPIPLLSIPEIEQLENNSEFTTSIHITYKNEFFDDIEKQVKQLRPEILLFLHSIKEIIFRGFNGRPDIKCSKQSLNDYDGFGPSELISINEDKWHVFTTEGELNDIEKNEEDDSNFYQLKLAINENLENDYKYLFSFFPTQVRLDVPYLIHGTFDLDQNRNQLNNTKRNQKVLRQLVKFIIDVAKYYADQELSWKPLSLLNFKRKEDNATLETLGFNKAINKALIEEKLWPCISDTYKSRKECIYVDDSFSKFLQDIGVKKRFANLLIPRGDFYIRDMFKQSNISNIEEAIDDVSKTISDPKVRAKFIYQVNRCFPTNRFSLLTNLKKELIDKNDEIFTPSSSDIDIPSFCRIHFINDELYDHLISEFRLESDSSKARSIQRILKSNCRILSYEPQNLIQRIISGAKRELNSTNKELDNRELVIQMVQSLFDMFVAMSEPSEIRVEMIPLLNSKGDVKYSRELFINDYFESGNKAQVIFGQLRSSDEILAYPEIFGLDESLDETLESFFIWLGVNKFVRYEEVIDKKTLSQIERKYAQYALGRKGLSYTNINAISYTNIFEIERILKKLSIDQIIGWLFVDRKARSIISDGDDVNRIDYYYRTSKIIHYLPSYLQFMFLRVGYNFEKHLVESRYSWVNEISIDFNHGVFNELNIDTFEIESILKSLGGKSTFSKLSIQRVKEIINLLPEKFPDGKNSQTLYKAAVDHYTSNEEKLGTGYKLFAKTKEGLNLLDPGQIYFSDKAKIPNKLLDEFPILNYPSRGGGQRAIEFFGINDLADVEINISKVSKFEKLNEEFQNYLQSLIPYLLLLRIDGVESSQQRQKESKRLQNLNIVICSDLVYEANESQYLADFYEYIPGDDNNYYIKCRKNDELNDLKRDSTFSDSFANILSDLFDVSGDKTEFRSLFRNGIKDAIYTSKQKFGEELIQESKLLLGIGDSYRHFWGIIFKILNKEFDTIRNAYEDLKITTDLKNLDYEALNSDESISVIIPLFQELGITISAFNSRSAIKVSLGKYHRDKFTAKLFKISKKFRTALWIELMTSERDHKKELLYKWSEFENDPIIEEVANNNEEKIEVDYETYLERLVNKYGLKLSELTNLENIKSDPEKAYSRNKKGFSSKELSEIESDAEYRSLLYFKNELSYLKEAVAPEEPVNKVSEPVENGQEKDEQQQTGGGISVIKGKRLKPRISKGHNGSGSRPYVPPNDENTNKQTGNECEEKAYNLLLEEYGIENVDKVSNRDEGKHYDIRYSPDEGKRWIYVEVKKLSNGRFNLTRSEKEFGEKHGQDYELHLVDLEKNEIFVFNNPFSENDLDFVIKDYWVYYQITD